MATKITKVKLSNGQIYSFFDEGAIRLNENGILITGNTVIDSIILDGKLSIKEIDDVDVSEFKNVLTQNETTGEIQKRSIDNLLEDIGGCSYSYDEEEETLCLKIGKQ